MTSYENFKSEVGDCCVDIKTLVPYPLTTGDFVKVEEHEISVST